MTSLNLFIMQMQTKVVLLIVLVTLAQLGYVTSATSKRPTAAPTQTPTVYPTFEPTFVPTTIPTPVPTITDYPTSAPSKVPTKGVGKEEKSKALPGGVSQFFLYNYCCVY